MRFFKTVCMALVGASLLSGDAFAQTANQLNPSTYVREHRGPFGYRHDGLVYHKDSKVMSLVSNGTGFFAIGPTYRETFAYGAGLGIVCESVPNFSAQVVALNSADQTCTASCGQNICIGAYEAALADAGDVLDCNDATADACHCLNLPLDLLSVGCGTDWEAPALGITRMSFPSGVALAHVALLEQLIGPAMVAGGLNISGDLTDNDGAELIGGMYGASGRPIVPGVDPTTKFCVTLDVGDLSGTDELWVGFRSLEAPNATFNNYDTYAVIGVDNGTGDWHTETEQDGAGLTTTDVTLGALVEDTDTTACVQIEQTTRAVTYSADGAVPTDAIAFTFDSGEAVVPFVHFLHSGDVANDLELSLWEVSFPSADR